uniref:Sulfotransferase n=1 Tax=Sinocyclocheilus rhinocerous TaxID=307959 RepID=A0A673M9E4_9TELE
TSRARAATVQVSQGIAGGEVAYWTSVEKFKASKEDLLIAMYAIILNEGELHSKFSGMFNRTKNCLLEVMDPPRVIKTHLPIQLVPHSFWDAGCKVIYMARTPKDTVVSYYHFDRMNLHQLEPGPWPQYLEKFMSGQLGWGSWYDHDPVREVTHIAQFRQLSKSTMKHIVQITTFSAMRENPMANYSTIPDTIFDRTVSEFMRKVGDWKNHFSAEEDAAFEEHYLKIMADCPIPIRFTI